MGYRSQERQYRAPALPQRRRTTLTSPGLPSVVVKHRSRLPALPGALEPLAHRQLEAGHDVAAGQHAFLTDEGPVTWRSVDLHFAPVRVDVPDQPRARLEVLVELSIHLGRS